MMNDQYYTATRKPITKNITTGLTSLILGSGVEKRLEAERLAKALRRYAFEVFIIDGKGFRHVGFGIPK